MNDTRKRRLVELIMTLPPGSQAVIEQHIDRLVAKARRRRLTVINGGKTSEAARM